MLVTFCCPGRPERECLRKKPPSGSAARTAMRRSEQATSGGHSAGSAASPVVSASGVPVNSPKSLRCLQRGEPVLRGLRARLGMGRAQAPVPSGPVVPLATLDAGVLDGDAAPNTGDVLLDAGGNAAVGAEASRFGTHRGAPVAPGPAPGLFVSPLRPGTRATAAAVRGGVRAGVNDARRRPKGHARRKTGGPSSLSDLWDTVCAGRLRGVIRSWFRGSPLHE
jgi:hypothetical protein